MRILKLAQRQVYAVFYALDELVSALTGGAPGQTLSARFAKSRSAGSDAGAVLADVTDRGAAMLFDQPNHCAGALAAYEARETAAPAWSG